MSQVTNLEGGTGQRAGRDVDPCESRESQDEDSGDLAPTHSASYSPRAVAGPFPLSPSFHGHNIEATILALRVPQECSGNEMTDENCKLPAANPREDLKQRVPIP